MNTRNNIIRIDYTGFLCNRHDFIKNIREKFIQYGVVLIEKVSKEKNKFFFKNLALSLGKPSLQDVIVTDQYFDVFVHKVSVQNPNLKDKNGFLILSTTSLEFDCHTDGYFDPEPIDILILQCIIPDQYGGESIIVFLENVISQLDVELIKILKQPIFPSRFGNIPILTEDDNKGLSIRYNRRELNKGSIMQNTKLSYWQIQVLEELDAAINSCKIYLKLMPYECLIINNKKVLHGRTALSSENSNRLFKRVQIYS